jgi:hypothetical protein
MLHEVTTQNEEGIAVMVQSERSPWGAGSTAGERQKVKCVHSVPPHEVQGPCILAAQPCPLNIRQLTSKGECKVAAVYSEGGRTRVKHLAHNHWHRGGGRMTKDSREGHDM